MVRHVTIFIKLTASFNHRQWRGMDCRLARDRRELTVRMRG